MQNRKAKAVQVIYLQRKNDVIYTENKVVFYTPSTPKAIARHKEPLHSLNPRDKHQTNAIHTGVKNRIP